MNYPIWEIPAIGGGSLIALIAILHVYIAHLAVGGGMFIWLTDRKGYRENSAEIHNYVHKHTWFFLLLTMVFGGITGVGIWFIIALIHPAATSSLIHNFVFGWAIEWVFFLGEITALLVYYYQFDHLTQKQRMQLSFLYFLFAWLSLFIINGILSFMLTPGQWLETGNFWHGFFNPSFLPSLLFRTFAAAMIAGLFGYVTTVFLKDSAFRSAMLKYSTRWLLYPLLGLIPSGIWYYFTVPSVNRVSAFSLNPETGIFASLFIVASILIFLLGIFLTMRSGVAAQRIATSALLIIGLGWMGGFEYMREIARKPFVISDYMYSTSILKSDAGKLSREGILANAKWTYVKRVTPQNPMEAGEEIFRLQCSGCHTLNGIRNDIIPQTELLSYTGMISFLFGQGKVHTYMPEFIGTEQEKDALAAYIAGGLHKNPVIMEPQPYQIQPILNTIPDYDQKKAEYILLVWNDLGMHCISDSDPWFVILPPANTLEAQIIKRGPLPQLVADNIELTYRVEPGFENPAAHTQFWDYAERIFGAKLPQNVGLHGNGLSGKFKWNPDRNSFIVETIPVMPYNDDGSFNPYPIFTVEARDSASGKLLAVTQAVTPTSTEMGCRNCHGGGWKRNGIAGVSDETATNILKIHDRLSGTNLYDLARKGQPQLCAGCHPDPALGAEGKAGQMYLSASIHGWHANYMHLKGAQACGMCHPAYASGRTRCSRGIHGEVGVTCVDCHCELADHALTLLKGQADKPGATRLMAHLTPTKAENKDQINPRSPWLNEPDCLTCHEGFQKPASNATSYNVWSKAFEDLYRIRTDNAGIRCAACHNSTHAEYPSENPFGRDRDNIQPLQYSGAPYPIGSNISCEVCHMQKMENPIHHPNFYREFRNKRTEQKTAVAANF
ncbi:MAG: cytochrome C [Calditrichia bacterium]